MCGSNDYKDIVNPVEISAYTATKTMTLESPHMSNARITPLLNSPRSAAKVERM